MVTTIGWAIQHCDRIELLRNKLYKVGARHASYGIVTQHYDHLAVAFNATVAQLLNKEYNDKI